MHNDNTILRIEALNAYYGQAHVVQDVSMELGAECVALLGRNGAGKTTLARSLLGLRPPQMTGQVELEGTSLAGLKPYTISQLGVGYVPQGRRLFPSLTVMEHLQVVERHSTTGSNWTIDQIFDFFPSLAERRKALGQHLSGGELSMLAIARALMTNPRCLILDEPTEGLAPTIVERVCNGLTNLVKQGIPVLLIEQNLKATELAANRVYVMNVGRIVYEAPTEDFLKDPQTRDQYLGLSGIQA
ncbi:ABC transporter ATP-binding protein [Fodinicurvata halophila]|uniref:ABC transporter ATP-binding protein n=2 Tax=Fodinicurvata halophila TaxID=1419723 RepID=A0ABV8UJS6_9PROT